MHLGIQQFLISHPKAAADLHWSYAEPGSSALGKELM